MSNYSQSLQRGLQLLDQFEKQLHPADPGYDALVYCYLVHYQFEAIHPFLDGNGRVGRALLSLMMYQNCGLAMPWLYMSAFFERYKDEHIDNLFAISARGDWRTLIEFCLRGTIEQANDSIERCSRLQELKERYLRMIDSGERRIHPIVEALFIVPAITIPETARQYKVTYPTAKADVKKLEKLKILAPLPNTHPKLYYCEDIFAIAYGEPD